MLLLDEPNAKPVRERWARVERLGLRADADAYPIGTTRADLAVRRDRVGEILREERALLEPIGAELTGRALVAIVADRDGVILTARGGGAPLDPATRVRLVEGARWSEDARGTNAIGTALAEGRMVGVLGAAHFERRNHGLFCYATPVRDAYGDVALVLDVTGPIAAHDPTVAARVAEAGAAAEQILRALAYARAGSGAAAAIERLVMRCASPALLVEANGAVRVVNAAARGELALDARSSAPASGEEPLTCARLFGMEYAELQRLALDGARDVRFETRAGAYAVELDAIAGGGSQGAGAGGAGRRALAVIVHMERTRTLTRARATPAPTRAAAHPAFAAVLGRDAALLRAKDEAARFAATPLPVLLLAETGTGKELFARAIHAASPRAAGPFVPLNCGSLAPTLLEAELFGYAPGAFTGASREGSDGRLGAAHGGTLFLDEIAEMPDALQTALLRVLDDGVYHRVGDARPRRADFRLVCATCRDLPAMVERGAFRRDLFYRIHGASVTMPPLRARTDRVWLAEALLARAAPDAALADDARAWTLEHDWPGNVRELKTALSHAAALAEDGLVRRAHFPRVLVGAARAPSEAAPDASAGKTRDQIVRDAIADTVRACAGNLSEAARRLGIARSTIYRAMRGK